MKVFKMIGHQKPISVVMFNWDGDLLFSASSDKKVNLWDSYTGERLGSYMCKGATKTIATDINSNYLFTGSLDGVIQAFEVNGGKHIGAMRKNAKCKHFEFSFGDKYLLVLYESMKDSTSELKIYETSKLLNYLKKYKEAELPENDCEVYKAFVLPGKYQLNIIKWSSLNEYIIAGTSSGSIVFLDLNGNVKKEAAIHDTAIKNLTIAKDFSLMATVSDEGGKVIDPASLEILRSFKYDVPMNACAISPLVCDKQNPKFHCLFGGGISARDVALVKIGGFEMHLCNIMYEKEIGMISGHFGPVNTIMFHQDGRGFVSGGEEGIIRLHRFPNSYFEDNIFE